MKGDDDYNGDLERRNDGNGAELEVEVKKDLHGIGVVASSIGLCTGVESGVSIKNNYEAKDGVFKEGSLLASEVIEDEEVGSATTSNKLLEGRLINDIVGKGMGVGDELEEL